MQQKDRFLILHPCTECDKAEARARRRNHPAAALATCAEHTARRMEPEPTWGLRQGFRRANLRGVDR